MPFDAIALGESGLIVELLNENAGIGASGRDGL
jgi:hypothetical protein